ncbi:hypothetical protein BGZ70_010466 [Mortierella alpina]|uniref:RRM domain-containing protein n=1 Tax=Mortierella alpina TaxID=64518 RepID=A0A9P6M5I0_MORAP|nr:hypothetical protein BGZ70_010466 [Mortierella alpina]
MMMTPTSSRDGSSSSSSTSCMICQSKDQQILAKEEVIRAKDDVIAAKDDALAQKDLALKTERELRERLQRQLKTASTGEEKDALTIYIRNVTESITYEMLHDAFSAFGVIRTLNVVHPKHINGNDSRLTSCSPSDTTLKACAFVEFTTSEAHQRALAATSVPVGYGHEDVLTEKRVRKPQQQPSSFSRRASSNNLKSQLSNSNLQAAYTLHTVSTASGITGHTHSRLSHKGGELTKEDEGCDLTAAC